MSRLRLRPRIEEEAAGQPALRMWAFPWLTWAALAAVAAVLVLMLTDDDARPQVLGSSGATSVVLLVPALREVRERHLRDMEPLCTTADLARTS
ncbi:hypothetical protein GCM10010381_11270 [Streptomyces xantholiticus]|nr:hypothetical protein GCM10010381_11270 [Streptomyces xantholiticus]